MGAKVNMDGVWFVHYTIKGRDGNVLLTISGDISKDNFLDVLYKGIFDSKYKAQKDDLGCFDYREAEIVIKSLTKIGNIS